MKIMNKSRKNKKSKIVYNNINVDSNEEWQFFNWLDEAKTLGIVIDYEYQPEPFIITNKFKYNSYIDNKEKHLMQNHIYTCDFKIWFSLDFVKILSKIFKIDRNQVCEKNKTILVYTDIKGSFNRFGGDRLFSIHQKLVYDKYNIYVEKIVPKTFFKKAGIAKNCLKTPSGRVSKIYASYNFIDKMFDNLDNSSLY